MKSKSFLKLLITFILIFTLMATTVFAVVVCTTGGSLFGYNFRGGAEQSYINVLFLGVDKGGYRTDVIILGQLNLAEGEINMLQIPRDTYVNYNRGDYKINSAYGYNKEKQVFKEVGGLLGIDVDKFVLIDTAGFRDLIDTIGGVEFDVPINMNYDDPTQDLHIHLEKGLQRLDGDKAEQFVRFRKNNDGTGYARGDIERMEAQSAFIQATVDELFNIVNVFKLNDLVKDFSKLVETNFSFNEMLTYAPYIFSMDREKMYNHQLCGEARYINGGSYFVADDYANEKLIEEHFTPSADTISKVEVEIQNSIIGSDSPKVPVTHKVSKAFANRFVSVDIIDATDGKADIASLKEKLKDYGFTIKNVTGTLDATYPETLVVSREKSARAEKIADALELGYYRHNEKKSIGSAITIVIGEDFIGKE